MPDEPRRLYRVQAALPDGTVTALYASTAAPERALSMSLGTWRRFGVELERLLVFAGQNGNG